MIQSTAGCLIGDPYTESRILNDTQFPIVVTIKLDVTRYGVNAATVTSEHVVEWFKDFKQGDGVKTTFTDPQTRMSSYKFLPGGYFIAHSSLGRKPYFTFNHLSLSQNSRKLEYQTLRDI